MEEAVVTWGGGRLGHQQQQGRTRLPEGLLSSTLCLERTPLPPGAALLQVYL